MELDKIISTLMHVETKGENTLIMADCIRALAAATGEVRKLQEELNELKDKKEEEK